MLHARRGDRVRVHYRVSRLDGEAVDMSPDGEPLELVLGVGRYLAGFEEAVVGMAEGEQRDLVIPPESAFGHHIGDLVQEIDAGCFPGGQPPEVGQAFWLGLPEEGQTRVTVVAVSGDRVVVDGNHPLAGEALRVQVALLAVLDAAECAPEGPTS